MDKIVKLIAGNYTLSLEVNNSSNWCKVYFIDSQKTSSIFLGADDLKVVCSKLKSALKWENLKEREMYRYGDIELFWILSLFEKHASIYGSVTDNYGIKIFCVEDGGHYLPEFHVEKNDIQRWISTLEKEVQ